MVMEDGEKEWHPILLYGCSNLSIHYFNAGLVLLVKTSDVIWDPTTSEWNYGNGVVGGRWRKNLGATYLLSLKEEVP